MTTTHTPDATDPAGIPCPKCGGPTIAPTPGRPEEEGDYCEACGIAWDPARVAANAAPAVVTIRTKYRGPDASGRGARIVADAIADGRHRLRTVPLDHGARDPHAAAAIAYAESVFGVTVGPDDIGPAVHVTDDGQRRRYAVRITR